MKCSEAGISLIKEFEGYRSEAYDDVGGKPTIGYGHLIRKGERFGKIDEAEATRLLCRDLCDAEACIEAAVDVVITPNQHAALCSFVYNLGCARLLSSTLLKKLNARDFPGAAGEFEKWCKVGQNRVDGLLRRRIAERLLFEAT